VPFRRLSEQAVRVWLAEHAPALPEAEATALARVAAGRLDRARRLLDPSAQERRVALIAAARGTYLDERFDPVDAAGVLVASAAGRAAVAREREEAALVGLDLPPKEAEQRAKRVARGAEREELLAQLEELAAWYRDLVVVAAGAEQAAVHADHLDDLRADAARGLAAAAERAAALVRQAWRDAEEFNVNVSLALEALFVRLRRELARG
jgi:DNA polymerase-3 subunit delta'